MAKILIADDDEAILESTTALLELYGHEAATVSRADRIFEAIERERPDVLLQDGKMPGLDAIPHVARLRERFRDLAIVVFTGDVDLLRILEKGAADAGLPKPFDPPELAALIDRLLAERRKKA